MKSLIILMSILILPNFSFAETFSGGLRLGALYDGVPSAGLVLTFRPIGKFAVSGSYMAGGLDAESLLESAMDDSSSTADGIEIDKALITKNNGEITFRYYPMSGSFFLSGGVGMSKTIGEVDIRSSNAALFVDEKIEYDSNFATLSVGNIWTFFGVMIGAEWVGRTRVLSHSKKETSNSSDAVAGAIKEGKDEFTDLMKTYGEKGSVHFFVLHLGVGI